MCKKSESGSWKNGRVRSAGVQPWGNMIPSAPFDPVRTYNRDRPAHKYKISGWVLHELGGYR